MSKLAALNKEKLQSLMKQHVYDLHRQWMMIIENEMFRREQTDNRMLFQNMSNKPTLKICPEQNPVASQNELIKN